MPGMPGPNDTADSIDIMYEQAAVNSGFCATRSYTSCIYNLYINHSRATSMGNEGTSACISHLSLTFNGAALATRTY